MPVLRSAFIALSKNRPLRSLCENTRFGRKMSSRFVAGMEIGDALRVTQALISKACMSHSTRLARA